MNTSATFEGEASVCTVLLVLDHEVGFGHITSSVRHLLKALSHLEVDVYTFDPLGQAKDVIADGFGLEQALTQEDRPSDIGGASWIAAANELTTQLEGRPLWVLFPWWNHLDLDELRKAENELPAEAWHFGVICNVGSLLRESVPNPQELAFWRAVHDFPSLRVIYFWDSREIPAEWAWRTGVTYTRLPEVHDVPDVIHLPRGRPAHGGTSVGFFGGLSASRGLGTIALLALRNPGVRFVVHGYGFRPRHVVSLARLRGSFWGAEPLRTLKRYLEVALSLIAAQILSRSRNVSLRDDFLPTTLDLCKEVARVDWVFMSGNSHPYSSGIALQALSQGKKVVWTLGNSAASEHLATSFPQGMLPSARSLLRRDSFTTWLRSVEGEPRYDASLVWAEYVSTIARTLCESQMEGARQLHRKVF